jgi:malate dehydrogenase
MVKVTGMNYRNIFKPGVAFKTNITLHLHLSAVCGAAGGIGQPLSLLLKQSSNISHLSLFDIVNTPGVAADLR